MTEQHAQGHLADWSALHGGVPPTGLVGAWLRLARMLVRPFAALRVPPSALTLLGVALGLLALLPASPLPVVAAVLITLSGVCDGLDGTLALLTARVSRSGAVLDASCDRVVDLCLAIALWRAGASPWPALVAGVLAFGHEYLRAVARLAGMAEVGVVSVAERPTRLIVTVTFLLAAGTPIRDAGWWATAGAFALVVLGVIGLAQLSFAVARALR